MPDQLIGLYFRDEHRLFEVDDVAGSMVILTDVATEASSAVEINDFKQRFRLVRPFKETA